MRKLALSLMGLVLAGTISACACKAERAAADRLGQQQEKLWVKYEAYVKADPKLDAKAKEDELKLIESLRNLHADLMKGLR